MIFSLVCVYIEYFSRQRYVKPTAALHFARRGRCNWSFEKWTYFRHNCPSGSMLHSKLHFAITTRFTEESTNIRKLRAALESAAGPGLRKIRLPGLLPLWVDLAADRLAEGEGIQSAVSVRCTSRYWLAVDYLEWRKVEKIKEMVLLW